MIDFVVEGLLASTGEDGFRSFLDDFLGRRADARRDERLGLRV